MTDLSKDLPAVFIEALAARVCPNDTVQGVAQGRFRNLPVSDPVFNSHDVPVTVTAARLPREDFGLLVLAQPLSRNFNTESMASALKAERILLVSERTDLQTVQEGQAAVWMGINNRMLTIQLRSGNEDSALQATRVLAGSFADALSTAAGEDRVQDAVRGKSLKETAHQLQHGPSSHLPEPSRSNFLRGFTTGRLGNATAGWD